MTKFAIHFCCSRYLVLALFTGVASAQVRPDIEREIYEKDAQEMVRLAVEKKLPKTPARGAVPSEKAAIRIHVAVASEVFGDEHIRKQHPYRAIRSGAFWVVYGSVPGLGGSAVSVIRASNGEILGVLHQQ